MERKYRLRAAVDFRRTKRQGKSWANRMMVLCALPNGLNISRFGFSVSKRIGNAVKRNRVRRRIREYVRLHLDSIEVGWDLLFIVRPSASEAGYAEIGGAIDDLLSRSKLNRKPSATNHR